jgi:hypothetical protein
MRKLLITNIVLNKKGDTAPDFTVEVGDRIPEGMLRAVGQMACNHRFLRKVRDFTMTIMAGADQ